MGLVSLGREEVAASLATPLAVALSGVALLGLLVALGMALATVAPRRYEYRSRLLSDEKKIYQQLVANKAGSFRIALVTFGLGLGAFAWLIFDTLYSQLG